MPYDDAGSIPANPPAIRLPATPRDGTRALRLWLTLVALLVWVMVALGGATRLTGSGLSIMEWAPLSGALPPLSHAEWQRLYDLYRSIPQYQLVNQGFGLEGFQRIFWLEWTHRLWGRLIGLAFLLPFLWFWVRGRIPRPLLRLLVLFALGGLQGAVGWFMVASGFEADRTAVSPYRLVVHMGLALLLFAALWWTALSLRERRPVAGARAARRWMQAAVAVAALAMLAGGLVAGTHAGLDYNTFPLMDGRLIPADYARLTPFWRNPLANIAAIQFDHRLLATLLGALAVGAAWQALRPAFAGAGRPALAGSGAARARFGLFAFAGAVGLQYAIGVATLLAVVPVWLGTLHQAVAVLVLATALFALDALRAPNAPERLEAQPT